MLCSARELGLGQDHDGILELAPGPEIGQRFVSALALDDWRLDVEVTANRGDMLSHRGIARELHPGGEAALVPPSIPGSGPVDVELVTHPEDASADGVSVAIEDGGLCRRYLGAVIRGVRIGPSPSWLQARLRNAGARSINNVVDATNYVMLELGQPLHAFDLAKLAGSRIVVRRAAEAEKKFTTLDGVAREIDRTMLMICDAERPVAVAGVMGGRESEVSDETVDVLLECALFDPASIRSTRRALGISTDASYRYERGVDPEGMETALSRALELILATAGGTLQKRVADCHPSPWQPRAIALRLARVERILGIAFDEPAVRRLLEPLGFRVAGSAGDGSLEVQVPGFRSYDVRREIDLIEEIARTHGYDAFPSELGPYRPGTVPDHPLFRMEDDLRIQLAARGLLEVQTPAFVPEGQGEVPLQNPITREEATLRRDLLPSLLRRVEHNFARGERDVRLFELATSFRAGAERGDRPRETPRLGVVLTGSRAPQHWSGDPGALDLWDLAGLMQDVAAWTLGAARVEPADSGSGAGGDILGGRLTKEALIIRTNESVIGWGGRVAATAVDAPAWAAPVFGFEIELPADPQTPAPVTHAPVAAYQAVERDLALIVPDAVPAATVDTRIHASGGAHLVRVDLFDVYRGKGVPDGSRSLAFRLRFQSHERTLTDEDVDRSVSRIVADLTGLGVQLRG
jgi:phenylalanyl-tRNA synthetase beta chain